MATPLPLLSFAKALQPEEQQQQQQQQQQPEPQPQPPPQHQPQSQKQLQPPQLKQHQQQADSWPPKCTTEGEDMFQYAPPPDPGIACCAGMHTCSEQRPGGRSAMICRSAPCA